VPQITVSAETFRSLNQICGEMLQDFEGVINRLIADYRKKGSSTETGSKASGNGVAPDLTGTWLKEAEIGGKPLEKVDWNALMLEAVSQAAQKVGNLEALKKLIIVKHAEGKKEGYYFVPSANLSIQGQNANYAWRATDYIAKALHLPVKATFKWGPKGPNPGDFDTITTNID
jgi:hypothetical protein